MTDQIVEIVLFVASVTGMLYVSYKAGKLLITGEL